MKFFAVNPAMTQYVSLDEEKLVLVVPNNGKLEKVSYDWAYVQEINVLKDYYIMFLNGGVPVIIDRSIDAIIEGSQEALAKLIEEKGLLKPYKVYEKEIIKNFDDPVEYIEAPEVDIEEVIAKLNEVEEVKEPLETQEAAIEETLDLGEAEVVEEITDDSVEEEKVEEVNEE